MQARTVQRGTLTDVIAARLSDSTGAAKQPFTMVVIREAALAILGVLLLALSARLQIQLPFTPVPVTGQTFMVLLLGAAYGSRRGLATMLLYIGAGATGLPVFAAAAGAASYGYLAGFALAAVVVGWLAERGWDRALPLAIVTMLVGEVAIYLCGLVWLARFTGWDKVIALGFTPFVAGDALKLIAAALILPAAWQAMRLVSGKSGREDGR